MKREKAEKLFNLLGEIDDEIIAEADVVENKSSQFIPFKQKRNMTRFATIAASVVFLAVSVWGLGQLGMQNDEAVDWVADNMAVEVPEAEDADNEEPVLDSMIVDEAEDERSSNLNVDRPMGDESVLLETGIMSLTLEEAYLYPVFGNYLPRFIPEGFRPGRARRYRTPEEGLEVFSRGRDTEISWWIQKTEYLNMDDILQTENLFLLEELTSHAIEQLAEYVEKFIEVTWDGEGESGSYEYIWTGWDIAFSIYDGDVLVQINMRGVAPYEAWEMVQSIPWN